MVKSKAQACINWIKDYYKDNPDGKAIIGISGGKDSIIAAALCVEALGADRVIGVMMPNGNQNDIEDSYEIVARLQLQYHVVNIGAACDGLYKFLADAVFLSNGEKAIRENTMITTNTPARLRMTTLYAVAALYPNSRVVNTCNRSEDYVGYSTKYGDAAGDFSPLGNLTVREVLEIGDELGLPEHLVHKTPSDGMCGKSDEDNLGFTYEELDDFLLGTGKVSEETMAKIERLHLSTRHKYEPIPAYNPNEWVVDLDQLSFDDYADGGLVDPSVTASAMAGNAIMTGLDIAEPMAFNVKLDTITSVNIDTLPDLERLHESLWEAMCAGTVNLRSINDGIRNRENTKYRNI